jgi:8-oxo-dGTP diphosphatase
MAEKGLHSLSASVLVRRDNGDVLLVKTPKRGWELPGGQVDLGETVIAAAMREVYEESGIVCEVGELVSLSNNLSKNITVLTFHGQYVSGEPTTSGETSEVAWVSADAALQQVTHPAMLDRLQKALTYAGRPHYWAYYQDPYLVLEERAV